MRRPNPLLMLTMILLTAMMTGNAAQSATALVARGTPEHLLSGVDIFGSINQVIARHGRPTRIEESSVRNVSSGAGLRTYIWVRESAELRVVAGHHIDQKTGQEVEGQIYVEVTGSRAFGDIGVTGAGLSLGDTYERAREIYGAYFFWRTHPEGQRFIVVEWENKTTLAITLDDKGKINRIILQPSQA
jgi:hypothetical protein